MRPFLSIVKTGYWKLLDKLNTVFDSLLNTILNLFERLFERVMPTYIRHEPVMKPVSQRFDNLCERYKAFLLPVYEAKSLTDCGLCVMRTWTWKTPVIFLAIVLGYWKAIPHWGGLHPLFSWEWAIALVVIYLTCDLFYHLIRWKLRTLRSATEN